MTKTQQALDLVASGMSQYKAAAQIGINRATLSRAVKARAEKQGICPCCGQRLPEKPPT